MFACPYCALRSDEDADPRQSQWTCRRCHASSVTFSFLRNLAGASYVGALEADASAKPRDGKPCLHCQKKMARVKSPRGGRQVELDVCGNCSLVWFDPGEIISALERQGNVVDRPIDRVGNEVAAPDIITLEQRSLDELLPVVLGIPEIENNPEIETNTYLSLCFALAMLFLSIRGFQQDRWMASMAFVPSAAHHGITWLTSLFVHRGWWDLFDNLMFFVLFAPAVESRMDTARYGMLFLAGGLFGNVMIKVAFPDSTALFAGASGALYAVLAHYARLFPKVHISFFEWQLPLWVWRIRLPAESIVVLFFASKVFSLLAGEADISSLVEVTGAIVGLVFPLPPGTSRVEADKTAVRRNN